MGNVLCFIPEQFADFEITLALHLLQDVGKRKIITVGYTRAPVTSYSGLRCTADCTLQEAAALADVEAVLLPGGPIAPRDGRLVSFLQTMQKRSVLLAAICFGPQYLARAGLLNGRRYTTSCSPAHMQKFGIADFFPRETFTDARVVTDGNLITAQGHAFLDFAFALTKALGIYAANESTLTRLYGAITDR